MSGAWENFGVTTGALVAAGLAALLVALVFVVGVVWGHRRALRLAPWALLSMCVMAILVVTLGFSVRDSNGTSGINLTPLVEIRRGWKSGVSSSVSANLWGNIAMFVPLGAMLMWVLTSPLLARVAMATVAGLGLSLIIELAQLTLHRVADIDDIILNGSGALLGALVGLVCVWLVRLIGWAVRRLRGTPRHESPELA